jgi:Ulp1 family protease
MILQPLGLKNWHVQAGINVPQQEGTSDCGVYACQFAKYLALEIPFQQSFSEKQCGLIRKTMVVELADGRVRTPWR